jgi:hypothetical protein
MPSPNSNAWHALENHLLQLLQNQLIKPKLMEIDFFNA